MKKVRQFSRVLCLMVFSVGVVSCGSEADVKEAKKSAEEQMLEDYPYEAKSIVLVKQNSPFDPLGLERESSRFRMTKAYLEKQIAIMKSETIARRAINYYGLEELLEKTEAELVEMYRDLLEIEIKKGTELLNVRMRGVSEKVAGQMSYALLMSYEADILEKTAERNKKTRATVQAKYDIQMEKANEHFAKVKEIANKLGVSLEGLRSGSHYEVEEKSLKRANEEIKQAENELKLIKEISAREGQLDDISLAKLIISKGLPEAVLMSEELKRFTTLTQMDKELRDDGVGEDHARRKFVRNKMKDLKEKLSTAVSIVRDGLGSAEKRASARMVEANKRYEEVKKNAKQRRAAMVTLYEQMIDWEREKARLLGLRESLSVIDRADGLGVRPLTVLEDGWTKEVEAEMKARKRSFLRGE